MKTILAILLAPVAIAIGLLIVSIGIIITPYFLGFMLACAILFFIVFIIKGMADETMEKASLDETPSTRRNGLSFIDKIIYFIYSKYYRRNRKGRIFAHEDVIKKFDAEQKRKFAMLNLFQMVRLVKLSPEQSLNYGVLSGNQLIDICTSTNKRFYAFLSSIWFYDKHKRIKFLSEQQFKHISNLNNSEIVSILKLDDNEYQKFLYSISDRR